MVQIKNKDFFWKQADGSVLQVRICYIDGTIRVYNEKGHCLMRWEGLSIQQIDEVEKHFCEVVMSEEA